MLPLISRFYFPIAEVIFKKRAWFRQKYKLRNEKFAIN